MHGIALKYFVEVAQAGSLSAASQRLHVAVSAISRQIARLEEEAGAPLFLRVPRGMALSPAGRLLLAHARRTLLEAETVRGEIAALQGARHDEIRLAASAGPAQGFLPLAMAEFHAAHPDTRFTLQVLPPREAMRRTAEGEIDIAVTFMVEEARGVTVRHSQRAPVYVVMAAGHPLAGRARVALEDLRDYPAALMAEAESTARHLLGRGGALQAVGRAPVLESNYAETLLGFVRHSHAVTFAGYASVAWRLARDGLVARPVDEVELQSRSLQIQVMEGRLLPPAVERFVEHLVRELDALQSRPVQV